MRSGNRIKVPFTPRVSLKIVWSRAQWKHKPYKWVLYWSSNYFYESPKDYDSHILQRIRLKNFPMRGALQGSWNNLLAVERLFYLPPTSRESHKSSLRNGDCNAVDKKTPHCRSNSICMSNQEEGVLTRTLNELQGMRDELEEGQARRAKLRARYQLLDAEHRRLRTSSPWEQVSDTAQKS